MKIIYAGGMTISAQILETLCCEGEVPSHVFGYPPSLSHRSNYIPLGGLSEKYGFPLTNIENINDDRVYSLLKSIKPDWFMVFGWSQLVREELLRIPVYGTLGFHMTKLPEGRGRAPVAWTVIKGKKYGHVSLIWLKPGADNGDIAIQRQYSITELDDAETVVIKVNNLACNIIRDTLPDLRKGSLNKTPQDEDKATYWPKRKPEDGLIDWTLTARGIYNFIRAVTKPFPGAYTFINDEKYIIWKSGLIEMETDISPGKIIGPYYSHGNKPETGIAVAAVNGIIVLKSLEDSKGNKFEGEMLLGLGKEWKERCLKKNGF